MGTEDALKKHNITARQCQYEIVKFILQPPPTPLSPHTHTHAPTKSSFSSESTHEGQLVKVVLSFSCLHCPINIFLCLHRPINIFLRLHRPMNIDVSNEGQLFLLNANISLSLLASPHIGCFCLPFHPLWPDILPLLPRICQLFPVFSVLIWFGEQLISKIGKTRVSADGGLEEVEWVGGEGEGGGGVEREQIGVAVHGQERHHQHHGQHIFPSSSCDASHFCPELELQASEEISGAVDTLYLSPLSISINHNKSSMKFVDCTQRFTAFTSCFW